MEKLFLFLLFCPVSSAVTHSLNCLFTASSGSPNISEFEGAIEIDGIQVSYCDTNKIFETKQDWMKKLFEKHPEHLEQYKSGCLQEQPNFLKAMIKDLKQLFNQTGGVHVVQRIVGCEWDDETEEIKGVDQFGYEGEDFISLDLKTSSWTALNPQAEPIKQIWDTDKNRIKATENVVTQICPEWLKIYVNFPNSSLQRTELPSVSLLQKTPSSPVSCHATGFYPERSSLFWRKDGEEIHEDVDHGEILPNHDGTFQMSVDLNLSSVSLVDWRRYDCVFQLSGVKDDIVTRLDKAVIRTNWKFPVAVVVGVAAGLLLLLTLCIIGFLIWKRKQNGFRCVTLVIEHQPEIQLQPEIELQPEQQCSGTMETGKGEDGTGLEGHQGLEAWSQCKGETGADQKVHAKG